LTQKKYHRAVRSKKKEQRVAEVKVLTSDTRCSFFLMILTRQHKRFFVPLQAVTCIVKKPFQLLG
jgi:hypothetical protein